ncbi:unnamed protein product [Gadus morhua 'NCC']
MPYKRSRLRSCGSSTAAAGCVPEVTGRGLSTAGGSQRPLLVALGSVWGLKGSFRMWLVVSETLKWRW